MAEQQLCKNDATSYLTGEGSNPTQSNLELIEVFPQRRKIPIDLHLRLVLDSIIDCCIFRPAVGFSAFFVLKS